MLQCLQLCRAVLEAQRLLASLRDPKVLVFLEALFCQDALEVQACHLLLEAMVCLADLLSQVVLGDHVCRSTLCATLLFQVGQEARGGLAALADLFLPISLEGQGGQEAL